MLLKSMFWPTILFRIISFPFPRYLSLSPQLRPKEFGCKDPKPFWTKVSFLSLSTLKYVRLRTFQRGLLFMQIGNGCSKSVAWQEGIKWICQDVSTNETLMWIFGTGSSSRQMSYSLVTRITWTEVVGVVGGGRLIPFSGVGGTEI